MTTLDFWKWVVDLEDTALVFNAGRATAVEQYDPEGARLFREAGKAEKRLREHLSRALADRRARGRS